MLMKKQQIVVDNKIYEIIATVHDDDTNKDFVVYTDSKIDKNKGLTISCTLYHEENGKLISERLTETKEKETAKEIVEEVIEKLYNVSKKK